MPGDCHIHMVLDGRDYKKAMGAHREQVQDGWIRARLKDYADAGAVYLRDGGDALGVARRAAQLAPEYGIEYRTPLFPICRKGRYGGFIGRAFEDFAGYRALVDEVIREGGDFIKIMISGLMDFDHFGVITSTPLSKQEIADMIAYAHDRGMAVMAHANGAQTVRDALDGGVDSIEHGAYLDAECISQLAEGSAVWTPTLATIANLIGCGRYPDAVLEPLLALQMDNVRACVNQGGVIAAGSDAGAYQVPHVKGMLDEAALLRQCGISDAAQQAAQEKIRLRFRRADQ
ncbi:MAG: amidohydrolase family protein [Candidatus Faecivicinus sp.]